ncbi:YwmB family TATA-box binding protein [Virgibacillus halodenitrificans]|uniref:YwmB family TATA-box binding protein n=1 Tax=Virgibacillus halodenitrificans TaxID=1482 RepID=UPI0024C02859|nr:YwmB family TATA-box binding protein [Virgibacillus halodenitrificans]WHX26015.1 YwmB family TATA-box binding protein [Virgibacillus halodenitrificans]
MFKKVALISILLFFITTETIAKQAYEDELTDIANTVLENNLTITSWQTTIKQKIDRKKIDDLILDLNNRYLVTRKETEKSLNYSFESTHKSSEINEQYNVVIPKDNMYSIEFIVVIKGTKWSHETQEKYVRKLKKISDRYFNQTSKKFACLTTSNDGIIKGDYFLKDLTKKLHIQHVHTQYDNMVNSVHKKILYGYTPLWSEKIVVKNTPMNVQVAVKQHEDGTQTYMIGTPILINEY